MITYTLIDVLLVMSSAVISVLLFQLSLSTLRYHLTKGELEKIESLEDTPTVSLCIPARNENHALTDCLTTVIASDYPKLEILVLDDCSHDNTSQIIRSFAHDGVRFVRGVSPSDGWLGKNHAYEILANEANGKYIVFLSVDTRLGSESISQLVAYMQLKKLSMLSVMPQRFDTFVSSAIFSPLRYFWQVVLPLKFNTPLATSLWAIRGDALLDAGGIASYKEKVDIENIFASLFENEGKYRFLIANGNLSVSYMKKYSSQVETAIRTWYLTLNKSISRAVLTILMHGTLFVLPPVVLISMFLSFDLSNGYIDPTWLLASIAWVLGSCLYFSYFSRIQITKSPVGYAVTGFSFFILPLLAVQEIILIIMSFIAYKRGRVNWKGRNICYPRLKRY